MSYNCICQSKTTNSIQETTANTISLNFPFDNNFHEDNSILLKADAKGHYAFINQKNKLKFIRLRYRQSDKYLLLIKNQKLDVSLQGPGLLKSVVLINKGLVNGLMLKLPFNDSTALIRQVFSKKSWSPDSLVNILLPETVKELNNYSEMIDHAPISTSTKRAIRTELTYYYANTLLEFSNQIMQKISRQAAWKKIADIVMGSHPLPDTFQLSVSPAANSYMQYYIINQFRDIGIQMKEKPINAKAIVEQHTQMSYDTVMTLGNKYGEGYLARLISKEYLTAQQQQKLLYNMVLQYTCEKDLLLVKKLHDDLAFQFPGSTYLPECDLKLKMLKHIMNESEKSKDIVFLSQNGKISSLKDLIAPYKGKVIYLDIWGTWCGPCINEITQYTLALKEKFKGQNIVFLYIDMDYDQDDSKWKQFILTHQLTGYHFRTDEKLMENLWSDLLNTRNVTRVYPTYAIFDTQGNIVDKNAKKPSQGDLLYNDLNLALKK